MLLPSQLPHVSRSGSVSGCPSGSESSIDLWRVGVGLSWGMQAELLSWLRRTGKR